MKTTTYTKVNAALFALLMLYTLPAQAVVIPVSLVDPDGPSILGQVDTAADTFTISSWIENPGGVQFWTPDSLPLVWNAQMANGVAFDVPDDWDGAIGPTWGFLAPNNLTWNEGVPPLGFAVPGWGIGDFPTNASADETIFESVPVSATNRGRAIFVPEPASAALVFLAASVLITICCLPKERRIRA